MFRQTSFKALFSLLIFFSWLVGLSTAHARDVMGPDDQPDSQVEHLTTKSSDFSFGRPPDSLSLPHEKSLSMGEICRILQAYDIQPVEEDQIVCQASAQDDGLIYIYGVNEVGTHLISSYPNQRTDFSEEQIEDVRYEHHRYTSEKASLLITFKFKDGQAFQRLPNGGVEVVGSVDASVVIVKKDRIFRAWFSISE